MIHEELSGKIIGSGMEVLNELRPGAGSKTNAILVFEPPASRAEQSDSAWVGAVPVARLERQRTATIVSSVKSLHSPGSG